MDYARWGLGVKYPTKVSAIGGHFMFDDDQETPNTLTATFEFDDGGKKKMMVFEVRHWITNHEAGIGEGGKRGEHGRRNLLRLQGISGDLGRGPRPLQEFPGARAAARAHRASDMGNNWANFIDALRSRKHEDLNAPIEEGAISTTLVHLANISYRLGRTLHFDAASYSVTGDAEANRMFRREYRKPFVVPEKV